VHAINATAASNSGFASADPYSALPTSQQFDGQNSPGYSGQLQDLKTRVGFLDQSVASNTAGNDGADPRVASFPYQNGAQPPASQGMSPPSGGGGLLEDQFFLALKQVPTSLFPRVLPGCRNAHAKHGAVRSEAASLLTVSLCAAPGPPDDLLPDVCSGQARCQPAHARPCAATCLSAAAGGSSVAHAHPLHAAGSRTWSTFCRGTSPAERRRPPSTTSTRWPPAPARSLRAVICARAARCEGRGMST
jgi:hypothetical protein